MTAATFPPGRYGRRRERRRSRWPAVVAATLALVGAIGLAALLYQKYGNPHYRAQVIRFMDISDTGVLVEFRVTVPAGSEAVCVVRARGRDGAEVGRAEVRVRAPAEETVARRTYRLVTTARPVTAEVPRCRPAD